MSQDWTANDIPDQSGRVAIVTGANSGIGLETARELARKGAHVVLACRSRARAEEALADIRAGLPDARVEFMELDLADLEQVRAFAAAAHERFDRLDLLINNAGVMIPPASKTKQGYELQLGVNHIGHFALTGLLLDLLLATDGARVVNVSSTAHRVGRMNFDDLDFEARGYRASAAYGQSKLANLLFTAELARRLEAAGASVLVAAAHPGWTQTNLQQHSSAFQLLNPFFGMQPLGGALPTLRAATAPDVEAGDYLGPRGWFEMRGAPTKVGRSRAARSRADAERLWEVSEQRSGVEFELARA
ncbi:MAG: oxidoreductase [Myxococcota bacterium]|nr:oxidoreductase [Myxococcota bacterium]